MILVVAKLVLREHQTDALRSALRDMIPRTLEEDGVISYEVYQDLMTPTKVAFVEEWRDLSALDEHFGQRHFVQFQKKLEPLLGETPRVSVHEVQD